MHLHTSLLLIPVLTSLTTAVSIRNYNHVGCQGRYEQCSDINENVCCDRIHNGINSTILRTSYSTSSFRNLPPTAIGLACQSQSRHDHCGQVVDVSWGDSACAGRGNDLTGSFWFTCLGCPFPPPPGNGTGNGTDSGGSNGTSVQGDVPVMLDVARKQHVASLVQPDLVSIDGHLFPVNYGVPDEVTAEVYRVFDDVALGFGNLAAFVLSYEMVQEQS